MSREILPDKSNTDKVSDSVKQIGPRPPIPGSETKEENGDDKFDEKFHFRHGIMGPREGGGQEGRLKPAPWGKGGGGGGIKSALAPQRGGEGGKMAPSPKAASETGSVRGFEPEGSADVTPPFSESSTSQHSSGPAYMRWAENIHNLLSDPDGVELYKTYLKTENVGELLDFWFACEGLKRLPSDQTEKMFQLVKVINRKFLRSKLVPILEDTRKVIQDKIASKMGVDQLIFDSAQLEVEDRMTRTTYRNFLASDMYLGYIQQVQAGETSDVSAKCTPGSHSTESSVSGREGGGKVQHQDDSGHFSVPGGAVQEAERSRVGHVRVQGGDNTSDSTSGVSDTSSQAPLSGPAHPMVPNTSLEVSQLELEGPNVSTQLGGGPGSSLPTLHEHSELDLTQPSPTLPALPDSLLSSLTSQALSLTAKKRGQAGPQGLHMRLHQPEAQAGLYLQPAPGSTGGRVPHPYHAFNSAYNPVSRQDSELQSLSSDAQTTDDNLSSFTENSSHYSYRNITNKKYLRRQARRMQEQSRHNKESVPGQNTQNANSFIPRTARIPAEASNQLPPAEFAAVLTQKLEKVKREQELNEKLSKKLAEDGGSMVSQGSNRSLADILREKLIVPDDGDGDQSILDDHVSRIWTDKTPLRSPGDPSGRPRSPGFGRRSRGGASGPAPPSKMGPPVAGGAGGRQLQNRTLPGRGPPRLLAPQGGPGLTYHQDLAYYEVDSRQQGGPGTNDRVMEWMLDVERQTDRTGGDQRSQSSKGATKTSPRSARAKHHMHSGHRSMSQERGAAMSAMDRGAAMSGMERGAAMSGVMSTSWAAMGSREQLQYQQERQGGDQSQEKRRLGASLVMPPPSGHQGGASNNSTLRKPAGGAGRAPTGEVTVAVYTFSHEKGEPMPYRIKIPSKSVCLKQVKDFLPKKGAFRFYFKTEVDGDMCYEEETEDNNLVPLWEGKVLVQCRLVD